MGQWGEKRDSIYYINEFSSLKKRGNETIYDLNIRFNKLYNNIPRDIKPSKLAAKVTYVKAFSSYFSMVLREMRSTTHLVKQ
jgi:hypothetical protein